MHPCYMHFPCDIFFQQSPTFFVGNGSRMENDHLHPPLDCWAGLTKAVKRGSVKIFVLCGQIRDVSPSSSLTKLVCTLIPILQNLPSSNICSLHKEEGTLCLGQLCAGKAAQGTICAYTAEKQFGQRRPIFQLLGADIYVFGVE